MPELKLYTVAQIRDWLMHNHVVEGLSEQVIAPARAWAIIHNPYVFEDDPIAAAIFEDSQVVAFTSAFPEKIDDKRYWWFTSLWCNPLHQGKGYGLIVIGSLAEVHGFDCCLDRWGAQETIEIFSHFGHHTSYTPRYFFGSKINRRTFNGKLLYRLRSLQTILHRIFEFPNAHEKYSLKYISYIDDATYRFIQLHRNNDLFLRSQPMLNWIIQYPFVMACPLIEYTQPTTRFAPAKANNSNVFAVQVWDDNQMIGFYIIKHEEDTLYLLYVYYEEIWKTKVFASICDHAKQLRVTQLVTDHLEVNDYFRTHMYFQKYQSMQIHFAYPISFKMLSGATLQNGDGDNFTE